MPKKKKNGGAAAAATPRCDCPGRCECGNRPERISHGHRWDSGLQKWVGKGAKEQRVAAKLTDTGAKEELQGIVVESWQKLPWTMLTELCRREKRPKPSWHPVSSGGRGNRARVVLPDKKKADKDLSFCPKESSESAQVAKEAAALLALHHLQGNLPLERKLPEPFKTMWLALTSPDQEKQQEAVVTADRQFASRADFEKARREKLAVKNAAKARREAQERANPDAHVYMSKRVRRDLCEYLRLTPATNSEEEDDDLLLEDLDQDQQRAVAHVVALGFRPEAVLRAASTNSGVDAILSSLVATTEESELPPGFDPDGKNFDVVVPRKISREEPKQQKQQAKKAIVVETAEDALKAYREAGGGQGTIRSSSFSERAADELEALQETVDVASRKELGGFGIVLTLRDELLLLVPYDYPEDAPAVALRANEDFDKQLAALAKERFAEPDADARAVLYDLCTFEPPARAPVERDDAAARATVALPTPSSASKQQRSTASSRSSGRRRTSWWDVGPVHSKAPKRTSQLIETSRKRLPASKEAQRVVDLVSANRVVLIEGGTGCGKTTQVPQILLSDNDKKKIVVAQPRRLAAVGVASRVAEERGEKLGETIGCMVRGQVSVSEETSVLFCTTGVVLQRLREDPNLRGVTHVIVDEVHERSLDSDLLLLLLKKTSNVKIILMSATIEAAKFLSYFGTSTKGHLQIPGFAYPVQVSYRQSSVFEAALAAAAEEKNEGGAVLVFVASISQVSKLVNDLGRREESIEAIPLHGSLPPKQQRRAFEAFKNKVKVVVATNVAETSITIPDVTTVVDTLRANESGFEVEKQLPCLKETWIAKDAAKQRAGRAGRVRAGKCVRLVAEDFFSLNLADSSTPEVHRISMEGLVLQTMAMGLDPRQAAADLLDPPDPAAVDNAVEALTEIGALSSCSQGLTPLGRHCAALPCAARLGKLLVLGASLGARDAALSIAAGLSLRSLWRTSPQDRELVSSVKSRLRQEEQCGRSDHALMAIAFASFDGSRKSADALGLNQESCRELGRLRNQYDQALSQLGFCDDNRRVLSGAGRWRVVRAVVTAALYPQLTKIEKPRQKYADSAEGAVAVDADAKELRFLLRTKQRVFLHPGSANFKERAWPCPWAAYSECADIHGKLTVKDCSEASAYAILLFCGHSITPVPTKTKIVLGDDSSSSWLRFGAHPRVAVILAALRLELDRLLERKIAHPDTPTADHPVISHITRLLLYDGFY